MDNGKENGNYYIIIGYVYIYIHIGVMLGLYRENGKENGNYPVSEYYHVSGANQ